ncbi:Neural-cadherin [Araneus ventricosus]|uniref:Neural-cadherin n=1 Tax=Araneus ventricosus TaxID=182803 RepID=A0A4Y2CSG4_ARAVE|nr:Neural-cadherin [Araneus ventricosus]
MRHGNSASDRIQTGNKSSTTEVDLRRNEPSRIRYEITQGNIGGAFAVKNETGAIYVAGPLDYESRKEYKLRLVASDNLNENHTTVVIHIKDVNDNPPMFDRPTYETQITEEDDRNLPKRVLQVLSSFHSYSSPRTQHGMKVSTRRTHFRLEHIVQPFNSFPRL